MLIQKVFRFLRRKVRIYVFRDEHLLAGRRWFRDNPNNELLFEHSLTKDSFVLDAGGYLGDYAAEIRSRYDCKVLILEPVLEFFEQIEKRFEYDDKVEVINVGLAHVSGSASISLAANSSSIKSASGGRLEQIALLSFRDLVERFDLERIDLVKMNIEGSEFDVLPSMLNSSIDIKCYLVQFHKIDKASSSRRSVIRRKMSEAYDENWNYYFVWEKWSKL